MNKSTCSTEHHPTYRVGSMVKIMLFNSLTGKQVQEVIPLQYDVLVQNHGLSHGHQYVSLAIMC